MTALSICIPLNIGADDPSSLVAALAADPEASVEIIIIKATGSGVSLDAVRQASKDDGRVIIKELTEPVSVRELWKRAITQSTGDWVTVVLPNDYVDPDLALLVEYLKTSAPGVDAFAWNIFAIDHDAEPGKSDSVAIPIEYAIHDFDKTVMLKSFFHWNGSNEAPKMPFGVYHAAIRRSLIDAILQLPSSDTWLTPLPQHEWSAKVLLSCDQLAFCDRPISARQISRQISNFNGKAGQASFPFHPGLGTTGAIAEVQFNVLADLGTEWAAGAEDFVRACAIDCMRETDPEVFRAKANGYFSALRAFESGHFAPYFRPEFVQDRPIDRRRGLHGKALMVDRFLGGARTSTEFYKTAKSLLAPVRFLCGGQLIAKLEDLNKVA